MTQTIIVDDDGVSSSSSALFGNWVAVSLSFLPLDLSLRGSSLFSLSEAKKKKKKKKR